MVGKIALLQIYKDVAVKNPLQYNGQTILLMDTDGNFWRITINIEDYTATFVETKNNTQLKSKVNVLDDEVAEYFIGLNSEDSLQFFDIGGPHCLC